MLPDSQAPAEALRGRVGPSPGDRRLAVAWAAGVLLAVALRPLWLLAPAVLPACQFHTLTGLPCPTCGTGRAAVALLEGRPVDALAANPLMATLALSVLAGGVLAPGWVLLARRRLPRPPARVPAWALVAAGLVVLVNWAYLVLVR